MQMPEDPTLAALSGMLMMMVRAPGTDWLPLSCCHTHLHSEQCRRLE